TVDALKLIKLLVGERFDGCCVENFSLASGSGQPDSELCNGCFSRASWSGNENAVSSIQRFTSCQLKRIEPVSLTFKELGQIRAGGVCHVGSEVPSSALRSYSANSAACRLA